MLEEFRTQRIIWDKANKRIFDPIQTSGGDQNGRRLEVQILNNGEAEDLTGTDLYLAWQTGNKTHSGLEPFDALDASEGTFELYYPTGMLAHAGALRGGLALVDSDGRIVSREFIIQVDRNIVDDEVAESSNEFTALTEALIKVNNLEENYTPQLNSLTAQLAQMATQGASISEEFQTVKEQISTLSDGSPKGVFATLVDLQIAYPNGTSGIYVIQEDGNWYYWNTATWVSGGVYQATIPTLLPNDEYSLKEYTATVTNTTSVEYNNRIVRLFASFSRGECLNEKYIVVKSSLGYIIPHQWEDDRDVNFKHHKNQGRHSDGSLKNGYITIIDSFLASENKTYTIEIYEEEVNNPTPTVTHSDSGSVIKIITNDMSFNFGSSNKYLVNGFILTGDTVTREFRVNPEFRVGATRTYLNTHTGTTVKSFKVNGSGVIFKDFDLVLTNEFFDYHLKVRIYKNSMVNVDSYTKMNRLIVAGEVTGILTALYSLTNETVYSENINIQRVSWQESTLYKSIYGKYAHGDAPRGHASSATYPEYPVLSGITTNPDGRGLILGWNFGTEATHLGIAEGTVFSHGYTANLLGVSDSVANETTRVFNNLVGRITDKTLYTVKNNIKNKAALHLLNLQQNVGNSHLGNLMAWKLFGISSLTTISNNFKYSVSVGYGSTDEEMWTKYQAGDINLQYASRSFPTADYLNREFSKIGDTVNADYWEGILKSYAEMICRVFEERGYVPLNYGHTTYTANSNAAGLSGLAMGLKYDPTNTRWINAYDGIVPLLQNEFNPVTNILTDAPNVNLTIAHYLHYVAYSMFEYQKSIEYLEVTPFMNMSSYVFTSSSAYGALEEQKYCISSHRRGFGLTVAYAIYLLLAENTVSSVAQANKLLDRLVEQDKPSGGAKHPLENWDYINGVTDNVRTQGFEQGVLAEIIYKILDDKVVSIL